MSLLCVLFIHQVLYWGPEGSKAQAAAGKGPEKSTESAQVCVLVSANLLLANKICKLSGL